MVLVSFVMPYVLAEIFSRYSVDNFQFTLKIITSTNLSTHIPDAVYLAHIYITMLIFM